METRGQTQEAPWMKSLSSCVNKMKEDGYKEDFQITKKGLGTYTADKLYNPEQVSIVNSTVLKELPILPITRYCM